MASTPLGRPAPDHLVARRSGLEEAMSRQSAPADVKVQPVEEVGFGGLRFTPEDARPGMVILYFHGGALRMGSAKSWGPYMSRLAAATQTEILGVEYSLSPENPFPTAATEARAAYEWLASQGLSVVLGGDSAGCNLASGVAHRVAAAEDGLHLGTMLFSPWIDFTVSNASYTECADTDALFSREAAEEAAEFYAPGLDRADPEISPGLGNWVNQPPVLLETSADEVLRDDARALAQALLAAGVRLWYREVPSQPHDWHIIDPATSATLDSFAIARAFVESVQPGGVSG